MTGLGIALTVAFASLNVVQFCRQLIRYYVNRSKFNHLIALKRGMMQLRHQCTEAVNFAGVIESKPQQQFTKDLGHHVRSIEHSVDAMLESWPATKKQRTMRDLFLLKVRPKAERKEGSRDGGPYTDQAV